MPCLEGIKISILVQPDSFCLPEFPHPERTRPGQADSFSGESCQPPRISAPPPFGSLPRNSNTLQSATPKASVYVPSVPGARFSIRFSIRRDLEPSECIFFKMFMNGRNVVNWGTDSETDSGIISHTMYEPGDRWNFKQDGIVLKRTGIESRHFAFAMTSESATVANDGGLIEVLVFRAKGRRKRMPLLREYRDQEKYGIRSPSGGLVDNPEDMAFYDWILRDPVDAPLASFRFHYRSWRYMCDLNLTSHDASSKSRLRKLLRLLRKAGAHGVDKDEQEEGRRIVAMQDAARNGQQVAHKDDKDLDGDQRESDQEDSDARSDLEAQIASIKRSQSGARRPLPELPTRDSGRRAPTPSAARQSPPPHGYHRLARKMSLVLDSVKARDCSSPKSLLRALHYRRSTESLAGDVSEGRAETPTRSEKMLMSPRTWLKKSMRK